MGHREILRKERLKTNLRIKQLESGKLHELDKLKSHFFASIFHEFHTPLCLIKGTVEKLQNKYPYSADKPDYDCINRNSSQLLELINQLPDLSKPAAGKPSLYLKPGEITGTLKLLGNAFASLLEGKCITYCQQLPSQQQWVLFDADKLEKITGNLLVNAYRSTPAQGKIMFSAEIVAKDALHCELQIKVEDTGIGIGAEPLSGIFNCFHQAHATATQAYGGTGIGLALVKELVELHKGEIKANSMAGKGSTFFVTLPFEQTLAAVLPVEQLSYIHAYAGFAPARPEDEKTSAMEKIQYPLKQILVVEDNTELRQFMYGHLSGLYHVWVAENRLMGYKQALEVMPDLIISDVMMPQMDGVTLCHKLKTDERTSHIPVILLTAKSDLKSRLQGLDTSADDYLMKPFHLQELEIRVRNLMDTCTRLQEKYNRQVILNPNEIKATSTDKRFLQKALAILEINMGNAEFDVECFSWEVGMSRAHLHRKLTALTAQSPSEFIRNFRLKRASSLLLQHCGNVSEVAYLVGFSSLNYFTQCFK